MSGRDPLSGTTPVDSSGNPYPLATIDYYIVGTTTREDTYTTAALSVAHPNPITLGADGRIPEIFFSQTRMKRVFKDSGGTTIAGLSWDGIDKDLGRVKSASAPSPTYAGLEWHDTSTGDLKERNSDNTAWINRGPIDSVGNTASVTETLTGTEAAKFVTPDSLAARWQRGSTITPSGGTVSLPSSGGRVFNIAAGDFSAISSAQGGDRVLFEFSGVSIITHNSSSMDLPGSANITTAAGDRAEFVNLATTDSSGTNWRCLWGTRDDGSFWGTVPATQAQQETGTNLTNPVTPGRQHFHDSALKAWTAFDGTGTPTATDVYNFATGSSGITDNGTGDYTLTFTTALSTAAGYAAVGMCNQVSAGNVSANQMCVQGATAGNVLAASCRVNTGNASSGAAADENYNGVVFAGDI